MTQNTRKTMDSSSLVDNVDNHFRVFAGPGAGKTYWLVNHIRHVLKTSTHLYAGTRIACISYTVVAADEIVKKLDDTSGQVEVSTIHSFLYANIVKPYVHLIRRDDGSPEVTNLHSVEEHHASPGKIRQWGHKYVADNMKVALKAAEALTWRVDEQGKLNLELPGFWKYKFHMGRSVYSFPTTQALKYKQLYWDEGRLHHEDVLYFSYRILNENPGLIKFLTARYPYVFVDEFQDTTPIQTWIIRKLAEHGASVGVIGDAGQSIYKFIDARVNEFVGFHLNGQIDYEIDGNRRSTNRIVSLLNHIRRKSLVQTPVRGVLGEPVMVLVGDVNKAIEKATSMLPDIMRIHVLVRNWDRISQIKGTSEDSGEDIWDEMRERDPYKEAFLRRIMASIEFARAGKFDLSIEEMAKIFRARSGTLRQPLDGDELSDINTRGVSVALLKHLIKIFKPTTNVGSFYNDIQTFLKNTNGIKMERATDRGKFKQYADHIACAQLVRSISSDERVAFDMRTIHQAKGAEFDAVLVPLQDVQEFMDLLEKNLEEQDDDELRIRYVALSRAQNHLYISVPSLSEEVQQKLECMGLKVTSV